MKFLVNLIVPLVLMLSVDLQARQVSDIFSAIVDVKSRDKSAFKAAANNALVQVLSKASGQLEDQIRSNPTLATDVRQADKWIEQFSYSSGSATEKDDRLTLKIRFPEKHITDLLRLAKLPYWPANRPQPLLLIVRAYDGRIALVNDDAMVKPLVEKFDSLFGLVSISPDKRTLKKIDLRRLWDLSETEIQLATDLQSKDAIFVLRLKDQSFDTIETDWLLIEDSGAKSGSAMGSSLEDSLQSAFQWLAGQWARQYSVQLKTDTNEFILTVGNVEDFNDYMDVMHYLQGLGVVRSIFVLSSTKTSVKLAISLNTGWERFNQLLIRSNRLVPDNNLTDIQVNHFWWKG